MVNISPHLPGILLVYAACLLGLMSPGPNVLSVISTSMGAGRKAGVWLALGISAGTPIWGAATSLGLTALLATYASALVVIKIAGGLYLLLLAYKAFRSAGSAPRRNPFSLGRSESAVHYFVRGLTVQMTNPKAALTWIAIISLGVEGNTPWWVSIAIVLGTTVLSGVGHLIYAVAFSARRVVAIYQRARRWIEFALGAFFCFAGVKLLTSRT
jgi:threonine/homoserine/homoserine lactone efflux protein